ncbi:MAG: aminopeptidase P family protein [Phototrophicaceae bacterium]
MVQIDYDARLKTLMSSVAADVVALVPGPNMEYFTGLHFHLSERPTIAFVHADGLSFVIPQLEMTKLTNRPDLEVQAFGWSDSDGYEAAFKSAVTALGIDGTAQLGVDGMTMRVFEWLGLAAGGASVREAMDVGQDLLLVRSYKTDDEIALMQAAIDLSEEALKRTIAWAKVGMTELEISKKLTDEMSNLGTDGLAFGSLVLTGENSALPHGSSGNRVLGANEFLLIDFGGKKQGYPADITRTFCLDEPTEQMREIYQAVLDANLAAQAIAKPGVTCHEVDKAARDVIVAAGYGDYFTHRLGHGLGLSGHELPNIAENNHVPLEEGMVFTIEPGIYLPGVGGVRIEDDVVVTADGIRSLTTFPREL